MLFKKGNRMTKEKEEEIVKLKRGDEKILERIKRGLMNDLLTGKRRVKCN